MRVEEFYRAFREYEDRRKGAEELSSRINALAKEATERRGGTEELDKLFEEALSMVKENPFFSPIFERSFQSYCEAKLFLSFLKDKKIEIAENIDLNVSMGAFKHLLRDMRRYFLEKMEKAEIDEAKNTFEAMEEIFKTLEKLGGETEDLERMIERSREELYDYRRKREELDLDDVWFRR